jgi:hypothetical protein
MASNHQPNMVERVERRFDLRLPATPYGVGRLLKWRMSLPTRVRTAFAPEHDAP